MIEFSGKCIRYIYFVMLRERSGNFGMMTALLLPVLLVTAGGTTDIYSAYNQKQQMQVRLDSAVMAAAQETDADKQKQMAVNFMTDFDGVDAKSETLTLPERLSVAKNADGSLTGVYARNYPANFLNLIGLSKLPLKVQSTALAPTSGTSANSCIYVLGNKSQAVLINSGVNLKSKACRVDVSSTASPAFIMNAGSVVDTAKFCVKGTNYIKNGGTLSNLETNCTVRADPYAGKLPEPAVSSSCTTSGVKDGSSFVLDTGVHCDVIFNGSPTITFKPGLHIIKGRMIANAGSTIVAAGVTFYFPDVYSELRANGELTFTGTAPTSGTYKGILMFEKTSDAANNSNKQPYVFNGSKGEVLEGIVYLPNREVTYNSTTNQTSKISMVVDTIIMNSSNWSVEPYQAGGYGGTTGSQAVRLIN